MVGQAKQSGCITNYARVEPTRFESAPPLSPFNTRDFQETQQKAFKKTSALEARQTFAARFRRLVCAKPKNSNARYHGRIDCWREQ